MNVVGYMFVLIIHVIGYEELSSKLPNIFIMLLICSLFIIGVPAH